MGCCFCGASQLQSLDRLLEQQCIIAAWLVGVWNISSIMLQQLCSKREKLRKEMFCLSFPWGHWHCTCVVCIIFAFGRCLYEQIATFHSVLNSKVHAWPWKYQFGDAFCSGPLSSATFHGIHQQIAQLSWSSQWYEHFQYMHWGLGVNP